MRFQPSGYGVGVFPRVLAVSDLHADRAWFAWTVRHAARFDLICIGGDVCDVFAREPPDQQRAAVTRWLSRLVATGVPVALGEGNHDDRPHRWLEGAEGPGVEEGQHRTVGDAIAPVAQLRKSLKGTLRFSTRSWLRSR